MTGTLDMLKGQGEEVELAKETEKMHLVKCPRNQVAIKWWPC